MGFRLEWWFWMGESYYQDGRLSWPEAESLVDDFISETRKTASTCTTTEVLQQYNEEVSNHNIRRVHDALQDRCVVLRDDSKRTRFEIPDGGFIRVGGEDHE